jgi:hypothetical protein
MKRSIVHHMQLECLRRGIWETKDVWGRILTYQP